MRRSATAIPLALLLLVGGLVAGRAADTPPAPAADADAYTAGMPIPQAMLDDLHQADFLTVRNLTADLPHGTLTIKRGVIASYKGPERRTSGIVIGECDLLLTKLPVGPDTFNAFTEMFRDKEPRITVRKSYLAASPTGAAQLKDVGFVAALRKWEALKPAEQQEFEATLREAWSASWCDLSASAEQKCFIPRDPVEKEVFGAVWVEDFPGAGADGLTRIDFRVEADGTTTKAIAHDSGTLLMQHPYDPAAQPAAGSQP
jgi:hypothetical protein